MQAYGGCCPKYQSAQAIDKFSLSISVLKIYFKQTATQMNDISAWSLLGSS